MKNQKNSSARWNIALITAAITAIIAAVGLICLSILNYSSARQIANYLTPDGSMDSLTPERFQGLIIVMRMMAVIFLATGTATLVFPARIQSFLKTVWTEKKSAVSNWPRSTAEAFREIRCRLFRKQLLLPMAAFALLALLVRLSYVNDPFTHDEAYTFVIFATRPLRLALSDYHYPNNHLFHTFLVHISYRLFGNDPLAVRLPALLAGVGLVPAGYLLARRLYGTKTATIAAAALAASPSLIGFATSARGYSLLALFTVLVMILAVELTHRSNLFYWSLAALFSALGFYTLPVFLFPFGIIVTWLILSGLSRQVVPANRRPSWFIRLSLFVISTGVLIVLLYSPVFSNTGLSSIISNPYVGSLSWDVFWPTFGSRLEEIAADWTYKVPMFVTILAIAGVAFSIIFHRKASRTPVSTQLAALIFIPALLLIQRPNPWAKIWQFLLPLILIWAAAGLAAGLDWVENRFKSKLPLAAAGVGLLTAGLVFLAGYNTLHDHPGLHPILGPVEQSAIYLDTHLQENDIVVIAPIDDAPLWYYFYKYDLSQEYLRRDIPFKRAYVLVNRNQDQNIDAVLEVRGPDMGFLDRSTTRLVKSWETLDLYSIEANWQAVKKAYQLNDP